MGKMTDSKKSIHKEIWVDRETGVNYVFHASGYTGGMTPLLDRDEKPVVSPVLNTSRY